MNALIAERGDTGRAVVEIGDCNGRLTDIVATLGPADRALAFLDPYGLELAWDTVKRLAATRKLDVFINFSLMGVTRNLPRSERPAPEDIARLERVMADSAWVDELYRESTDMFGGVVVERTEIVATKLAERYATDLKTIFDHVSAPQVMTNSKGGPLYALILASQKPTAAKIMNDILAKKTRRLPGRQKATKAPAQEAPRLF